MDGKFAYTIKRVGEKLRAIAVHPSLGFLFVSDWGSDASIYRMLLDGSNSTQILKDLGWPNGLTIDHKVCRCISISKGIVCLKLIRLKF